MREPIKVPDGMDASRGLLQVVTEFLDPPPAEISGPRAAETGTSSAKPESVDALADGWIGFGAMQITPGRAFSLDEPPAGNPATSVPVAKRWVSKEPGRALLLESVAYEAVKAKLERLGADQARVQHGPAREKPQGAMATPPPDAPMRLATGPAQSRPGLVLDFIVVYSTSSYVFQTDQTYQIASAVYISSSATFQPGAILKFTTLPTAGSLTVSGTISTPGALLPRCVFTHADDNSIGEPFGSGNQQDKYPLALSLHGVQGSVQRLEIRHATEGIRVYCPYNSPPISNTIWRNCLYGVTAYCSAVYLQDLFMCNVDTQTFDLGGGSSFYLANPILTDCTTGNAAPVITVPPVNRAASVGGSATFSVTATGYGLTYQWYFNHASIPGATSRFYTRTAVEHAHAGQYHVVVANDVG